MKIACVGGGPGGLYFAISMKLRDPDHEITVFERNRPNDTFGWGVVFSDQTFENIQKNDPVSAKTIGQHFAYWDDIEVLIKKESYRSEGHAFIGIGRLRLLNILQARSEELGINIIYEKNIEDTSQLGDFDLVVASDGLNSRIRNEFEEQFQPDIDQRKNKFIWLGVKRHFDAFTFIFVETTHGWFWAHAYQFDKETSTFIVECAPETWHKAGIEHMSKSDGVAYCQSIFEEYLDGNDLIENASHLRGSSIWINFPRVMCKKWYHKNIVLLGDAVHTAHFSIGSGTKLAFDDATVLADAIHQQQDLQSAFQAYQEKREVEVFKLQNAARNSTEWLEDLPRYLKFDTPQFFYSLLTRSQRVSHENLRERDKQWLEKLEIWFAEQATGTKQGKPVPPMFTPFKLRDLELVNRVVMAPMSMYSAKDGSPDDFHLVHYGSRAIGGAGLILTEMTHISREGRITPGCTGMYKEEHVLEWKRVVDFVHAQSSAKIALQMGHAGPKGSTKPIWEGKDAALEEGWPIVSASPIPYYDQVPKELSIEEMGKIKDDFIESIERADRAGFDMIELHCAHGYLLSAFITPLSNQRTDEYGGSLENRMRFPVEVFKAIRAVWPAHKPISVRISAHDWVAGGIDDLQAVDISRKFSEVGADIIHVSSGQTSFKEEPVYGRMFQTPFSDRIRNEANTPTIAVGSIYETDHVNSIIAAGRADLC
ncbi:MAG: bifunctional salicylyl-CoA 5-hydroxylase/oxidoreductase, partial [Proteobacteria bacterium]|nr:bifunctional salicylyl-CoA 5-hydroxylase/oxidoreductase [Pseudomonadota bacterium]